MELKGGTGYSKFPRETVILDICHTMKNYQLHTAHNFNITSNYTAFSCHIQIFEKLDFSLVAMVKKHHTKINVKKVNKCDCIQSDSKV